MGFLLGLSLCASLGTASEVTQAAVSQESKLAECIDGLWDVTWKRFYLPRTHLFYDYLTSYEPGQELAHLPTAGEVRRQVPNECGYGTGMEDGMISAGVMLSAIVDRYAVTKEETLRQRAQEVFAGIQLSATAHGAPGFLARGVCAEDLKSIYPNSSRDQYTHAVHGLWLYFHSPLCSPETREEIGTILSAIADRMTRNVTPENNYDSLRADGTRDARGISRMWNVKGHEAARLPMIYAAAWDVTGKQEYHGLYRTYVEPAVEQSFSVEGGQPTYALLQMQASLELLSALERDPGLKQKMRQIMAAVSGRCASRARSAGQRGEKLDLTMLCTDWRTDEGLSEKGRYRKVWYCIRESGEAALTQLMDEDAAFSEEQYALLAEAITRLDCERVSSCGIFYLQAAYWKARRRAGAENLAQNPGFEGGESGKAPTQWRRWGEAAGMTCAADTARAHTGKYALKLTDVNKKGNSYCVGGRIPVEAGTVYIVSCWVWAEKDQAVRLAVQMYGEGESNLRGWQYTSAVAGPRWQKVVKVLDRVAPGTAAAQISLVPTDMDKAGTGTVWFDDVEFRKTGKGDVQPVREKLMADLNAATGAREAAYFPENGQTVQMNPPSFVWKRRPDTSEYILQYSRSEDFSPESTAIVRCPLSVHTPGEVLDSGRWFWRYGVEQPAPIGRVFSHARGFEVPATAVAVPFPDVKQVVAQLAARPHPRVGVKEGELQALRERAASDWSAQVAEAVKKAEAYAGQDLLAEPAFLPPQSDSTWGPKFIRIMQKVRSFLREMDHCAFVYLLTGNERAGQEARRRLMHTMAWDPNGSARLSHNDEPGTEIVRLCPRAYDRIYPLLSEAEREKCREVFAVRMPQLYEALAGAHFESNPFSSHAMGYFLPDLTEASLAMAGEIEVEEWLSYCLQMLWAPFYPPYGGEDGGWAEGPRYWGWIAEVTARIFVVVDRALGVPIAQRPWLRQTGYYRLYGNPPNSKASPFGDGQARPASRRSIMYALGAYFRSPYLLWYSEQQDYSPDLRTLFLYGSPDIASQSPSELPQGRCFPDVGLACMHSDLGSEAENIHVMMRSSPYGSISHAYADQNAFVLGAFGEDLAIASGYYPYYGSPHHKQWSWQTKAANCITVDGQGQNTRSWEAKGKIVRFESSERWHLAVGDATAAYGGRLDRFLRHILFLRPHGDDQQAAIVILDDLSSPKPATFEWWLHAREAMQIDEQQQRVVTQSGAARLRVDFLTPGPLNFTQTDQFTVPPEGKRPNQWHLTASTPDKRTECRFVTVLLPYKNGGADALPQARLVEGVDCVAVEIADPATRKMVLFRTQGELDSLMSAGGVEGDGAIQVSCEAMP